MSFFDEVKSLGPIGSASRTDDQTQIGQFRNGNISRSVLPRKQIVTVHRQLFVLAGIKAHEIGFHR
jgi:hypothetical protein